MEPNFANVNLLSLTVTPLSPVKISQNHSSFLCQALHEITNGKTSSAIDISEINLNVFVGGPLSLVFWVLTPYAQIVL